MAEAQGQCPYKPSQWLQNAVKVAQDLRGKYYKKNNDKVFDQFCRAQAPGISVTADSPFIVLLYYVHKEKQDRQRLHSHDRVLGKAAFLYRRENRIYIFKTQSIKSFSLVLEILVPIINPVL